MSMVTIVWLGVGVCAVAAAAAWAMLRESASDLGSISRNWVIEHRNDHE